MDSHFATASPSFFVPLSRTYFEGGKGRAYHEVDNDTVIFIRLCHNLTGSNYIYQNGSIFFSKNRMYSKIFFLQNTCKPY
jgi:hypothetical protein